MIYFLLEASASLKEVMPKEKILYSYIYDSLFHKDFFEFPPDRLDLMFQEKDRFIKPQLELINCLYEYNKQLGATKQSLLNIERLASNNNKSVVVMCGHQPVLLTGPIFTIYKALQTIKLAEELSDVYKTNVIPGFWNASEDNDWLEVNHFYYPEDELLKKIEVDIKDSNKFKSFGNIELESEETFKKIVSVFLPTEFTDYVQNLVGSSFKNAQNFAEWFSALMLRLLSKFGLVIFDPMNLSSNGFFQPIFENEIKDPLSTTKLLNCSGKDLKTKGYKPQIHKKEDACCFFVEEDGKRQQLKFDSHYFITKNNYYTKDKLFELLHTQPKRFTSNVALRPILASSILPVAIYVSGPSEVSYFAQLKGIFNKYKYLMPVIIPRVSLTVVEPIVKRILIRYNLKLADFLKNSNRLISQIIIQRKDFLLNDKFEKAKTGIEKSLVEIEEVIRTIDIMLNGTLNKLKGNIHNRLDFIQERLAKLLRKKDEKLVSDFKKITKNIYYKGILQERTFNILYFLNKYGQKFIDELYKVFPLDYSKHYFYSLKINKK